MDFVWGDYTIVELGPSGNWPDLAREQARARYELLLSGRAERERLLRDLAQRNGYGVDGSDRGVQALNDMFVGHAYADPDDPGQASPEWKSLAIDAGLFLGDVAIARNPSLQWGLNLKRKAVTFNQPVLVGFTRANVAGFDWGVVNGVITYTTGVARRGQTFPITINGQSFRPKPPTLRPDGFLHELSSIARYA